MNLREYSNPKTSLDDKSKFIEICYADDSKQVVRKSSIVGLLSDSTKKVSSDRLKRVQDSSQSISSQQASKRAKHYSRSKIQCDQLIHRREEIVIGQWCVFKFNLDGISLIDVASVIKNTIIGTVLAFQKSDGKTDKQRQYKGDTALIAQGNVSVLSNWYAINIEGIPISLKDPNSFYVPINNYLATIENTKNENRITKENLNSLKNFASS